MPGGLAGFPDLRRFNIEPVRARCLFRLLRSEDDPQTAFFVLPVAPDASLVPETEMAAVCRELQVDHADLLLILIVTMRRDGSTSAATANLRAPLFIDTRRRLGWQVILGDPTRPLQCPLQWQR